MISRQKYKEGPKQYKLLADSELHEKCELQPRLLISLLVPGCGSEGDGSWGCACGWHHHNIRPTWHIHTAGRICALLLTLTCFSPLGKIMQEYDLQLGTGALRVFHGFNHGSECLIDFSIHFAVKITQTKNTCSLGRSLCLPIQNCAPHPFLHHIS